MKTTICNIIILFTLVVTTGVGQTERGMFTSTPLTTNTTTISSKHVITFQERNALAMEILVSNNGFGLGAFYRRPYSKNISGFMNFSVSEANDDREISLTDYYGNTYYPGKINRFFLIPLMIGGEYRIFSESISDNFRPYLNFAAGPTLIYSTPAQVEFFSSLSKGQSHFSGGGYIGFGAYWGSNSETLLGVNIRYMFAPFPKGIASLQDPITNVTTTMNEFGGVFITLTFGKSYN